MNMTTTFKLRVSLLGMALLVLAPLRLLAQAATGEMSITVSDSTGAAVPGAQVVITGTDTGAVVRTLTTNSAGIAEVPLLQPGRYNTHVTAPGFKAFDRNGVTVDVDSVVSLNLALQLGEASEVVTVTGALPVIEEKSETISEVIDSHQVLAIPLQGRNYLDAANYVPGVVPTAASRDNTFSAYGNTGLQNAFLLDGARNVNYIRGLDNRRRDIIRPPLDALNEFTVDTIQPTPRLPLRLHAKRPRQRNKLFRTDETLACTKPVRWVGWRSDHSRQTILLRRV
jgi:predicted secreted protein